MPRIAGQIDRAKKEAILEAASAVLYERGLAAPVDEIARRAGVSKQTIYNHYGSKPELISALIERRVTAVTANLGAAVSDSSPLEALTAYARALLQTVTSERGVALVRLLIQSVPSAPELAEKAYAAGVRAGRRRLAEFLAREARAGRLSIEDANEAAEFFTGLVINNHQTRALFGLPTELTPDRIEHLAREAAYRFMRAYGP